MSFQQDQQYQQWVQKYRQTKAQAEGRLRQARDRLQVEADAMRDLKTEIQADTTGQITQSHLDEVDAQISRFDGWVAAIDAALAG